MKHNSLLKIFLIISVLTLFIFLKFVGIAEFGRLLKKTPESPSLPTPIPTPTPSPTPKPLTFSQMNELYGPCVYLPTLMYHHVQSSDQAKSKNQTGLTVTTETFVGQMQDLKSKGYNTVSMQDLINFFEAGTPISKKSILITFDDAYADFATDAYPVLVSQGYRATVFVPTGLINNPDYMSWETIRQISSEGRVLFANHTWSHRNVKVNQDVLESEISTADTQLTERGLGIPKVFSYPYGLESKGAVAYLGKLNYQLAFTTILGSTQCRQLRFDLPRIRIGNTSIGFYGF